VNALELLRLLSLLNGLFIVGLAELSGLVQACIKGLELRRDKNNEYVQHYVRHFYGFLFWNPFIPIRSR
jgi:hypothetical protein